MEKLLENLQIRYSYLDLGELKNTFGQMMMNYQYLENILHSAELLVKNDLINDKISIVEWYKQAINAQ